MLSSKARGINSELVFLQNRMRGEIPRSVSAKKSKKSSPKTSKSRKTKSKSKSERSKGPIQRTLTPYPVESKRSTGAKRDRSLIRKLAARPQFVADTGAKRDRELIRQMAKNYVNKKNKSKNKDMSATESYDTPATMTGKNPLTTKMHLLQLAVFLLLSGATVFAYFYYNANPKSCKKVKCPEGKTRTPENPLNVVAMQLTQQGCTRQEKSKKVRQIVEDTLEKINYSCDA